MINNQGQLLLDIKIQDKFRAMLATGQMPQIVGVVLGDSDIDYNVSPVTNSRIVNAPFNVEKIKYPLVYSGSDNGLEGYITCFARKVTDSGTVSSLYGYPPDATTFTTSVTGAFPNVNNGLNISRLDYPTVGRVGYVCFFQTLLLNYYDPTTNLIMRLNEPMKFDFSPTLSGGTGWEIIVDNETTPIVSGTTTINLFHNSCLITGPSVAPLIPLPALMTKLTVTGQLSNIKKSVDIYLG